MLCFFTCHTTDTTRAPPGLRSLPVVCFPNLWCVPGDRFPKPPKQLKFPNSTIFFKVSKLHLKRPQIVYWSEPHKVSPGEFVEPMYNKKRHKQELFWTISASQEGIEAAATGIGGRLPGEVKALHHSSMCQFGGVQIGGGGATHY